MKMRKIKLISLSAGVIFFSLLLTAIFFTYNKKNEDSSENSITYATPNSALNPAGLNETLTVTIEDWFHGKVTFETELTHLLSGERAWEIIKSASSFNQIPGYEEEYIMAKFRIKHISSENNSPFRISFIPFDGISSSGEKYPGYDFLKGINPSLDKELKEGEEHSGWKVFLVNAFDESPVAVMAKNTSAKLWFDLRADK